MIAMGLQSAFVNGNETMTSIMFIGCLGLVTFFGCFMLSIEKEYAKILFDKKTGTTYIQKRFLN